jgi:hypothetical protein
MKSNRVVSKKVPGIYRLRIDIALGMPYIVIVRAFTIEKEMIPMRRIPRLIVVFTGTERTAPVVFYQLATNGSYRSLTEFIEHHPRWEVTTGWNRRRFDRYRSERLKQGLDSPYFRETTQGWLRVNEPSWPLVAAVKEERLFAPSLS